MDMRKTVLNLGLRALRLAGGLLLIYASMVFYLALTERQNAYPRAITHNEAQAAIQKVSSTLTCTLEDGIALEGWSIGNAQDPSLLYYPDADEDAAQFLAEVQGIEGYNLVAFNYRGSANKRNGAAIEEDKQGNRFEGSYKDDERDGKYVLKDKTGKVTETGMYVNGRKQKM